MDGKLPGWCATPTGVSDPGRSRLLSNCSRSRSRYESTACSARRSPPGLPRLSGTMARMLSVRRVNPDDWPEWRRLRREALREAPYAFDSALADWSGLGDTEERWRRRLDDVPLNLVADLDGVAVGMISRTEVLDQNAELISMWVAPEARRRGVGEALVRALLDHSRGDGAVTVVLDVNVENGPAIALYARCGFVDKGCLANHCHPRQRRRMQVQVGTGTP